MCRVAMRCSPNDHDQSAYRQSLELVPRVGIEPTRCYHHQILSLIASCELKGRRMTAFVNFNDGYGETAVSGYGRQCLKGSRMCRCLLTRTAIWRGKRQAGALYARLPAVTSSHLGLLRQRQGIIDLDAEVPDGAFQFAMSQQQLYGTQILRALVDQRGLGAPQGMRAVVARV